MTSLSRQETLVPYNFNGKVGTGFFVSLTLLRRQSADQSSNVLCCKCSDQSTIIRNRYANTMHVAVAATAERRLRMVMHRQLY